jgi:PTS system mannose-specific IIA component
MVNVIIVAHGSLAEELLSSAQNIAGKQDNLYAVRMSMGESLSQMQEKIEVFLSDLDNGDGTLILVDMVGGTPCNAAAPLCRIFNTEALTGVNLPMVLSAMFSSRTLKSAKELADKVFNDGQRSIVNIKRLF